MLSGIATLDLDVIGVVLEEMEDRVALIEELSHKVNSKIDGKTMGDKIEVFNLIY